MFNKFDLGVTVKVLLEFEIDGDADICTHELKLSEETCSDPEHVVLEVFVVTVGVSIASLKVTAMVELNETEVAESEGEVEETVGAVVSGVLEVVKPVECVYVFANALPELSFASVVIFNL